MGCLKRTGSASRSRTRSLSASSSETRRTTRTSRNENDNNKNREYPQIDRRIRETYIKESTAQKTKQYDMYKRFIRWASDRLEDDGIVGFVSNSAFLNARQDDGFRKVVAEEFNELWAVDLKGNARTSGERRRQEGGNVFSDKIRVGIAIYFLVRRKGLRGFRVFYNVVEDYAKAFDKIAYVNDKVIDALEFAEITPDAKSNWLDQSDSDFELLLPLANRETKFAKGFNEEKAVFSLFAMGISTNRDEWVYDFDVGNLRDKALFLPTNTTNFWTTATIQTCQSSNGAVTYGMNFGEVDELSTTTETGSNHSIVRSS